MGAPTTSVADAIRNEIPIIDYAQRCGFTLTRAGSQYSLKEHDSIRIDSEKNIFFQHSTGKGGSVIDFAMSVHNVDARTAISMLRKELGGQNKSADRTREKPAPPAQTAKEIPRDVMALPKPTEGKFSRVFAYLNKSREINSNVIGEMIKRKHLFEDSKHNCVFVGFDKENKPAFGCKRGTSTFSENPFRMDLQGSRKEVGWYVNNNSSNLLVCEAPIDAMSMMTLFERNNCNFKKYDYLAVGGTSVNSLKYHLERLPQGQLKRIYLAFDNDEAGHGARSRARAKLQELGFKGQVIDKIPKGKDWNEDLKACSPAQQKQQIKPQSPQIERSLQA